MMSDVAVRGLCSFERACSWGDEQIACRREMIIA
jgi:hypothetical protein